MTDLVEQLREYAEIEGSEVGEFLRALCSMASVMSYGASDQFRDAHNTEVQKHLAYMRAHTRIVKKMETRKIEVVDLEWLDDD